MSGVGIICFAASYAIVLAIEISRLAFRSGIRGAMLVGWAAAGMIAHSAFLYYQAVQAQGPPLSNWQDWFLVAAWLLMLVYLYLLFYHPQTSFGIFLLPLILGLIAVGWLAASPRPFARAPASQAWGMLHAVALALAAVALLMGLAAGLMYLRQDRRLKRKIVPGRGLRLPSLEWLQLAARRSQVVAALMLGVGIAAGVILNAVRHSPGTVRLPWNDPIIVSTIAMFLWLLVFLGASLLNQSLCQGRKAAMLAVINFFLFVAALAAGLSLGTRHGGGVKNFKMQIANCKMQNERGLVRHPSYILYPLSTFLQPTEARNHVSASRRL